MAYLDRKAGGAQGMQHAARWEGWDVCIIHRSRVSKGGMCYFTRTCDFVLATKLPIVPRACSQSGAVTILRMFMQRIHTS